MFNLPPGTLWLSVAMVAVFVLENVLGPVDRNWLLSTFAFVSTTFWPPGSDLPTLAGVMTLVTHAFLHANFLHIALNLGFLLAFGSFVERQVGLVPYLALFVLTAAAGALTEFLFRGGHQVALIGASGAVYGMTGAAARFMFVGEHPGQRRVALQFVLVIMGLNLLFGISGLGDLLAGARVGWKAHAGGFVVGVALSFVFGRRRPGRYG